MGLIIGFSMVITFVVMQIEFLIITSLALWIVKRISKRSKNNSSYIIKHSSKITGCLFVLLFLVTYISYCNYITTAWFDGSQKQSKSIFWEKHVGGGIIGSLFIINLVPTKSPPKNVKEDKISSTKKLPNTSGGSPVYKVIDSGMWVEVNTKIFWLDNNRVFFQSSESKLPINSGAYRGVIWDLSMNKAALSHPLGRFGQVSCVRDGQVFYSLGDRLKRSQICAPSQCDSRVTHYFGPIENGPEYHPTGENMWMDDRFDCDWVPINTARVDGPVEGPPYRYKLKGENYMEVLSKTPKGRMLYHEQNNDKGTEMPFNITGSGVIHEITYNPFLDTYIAVNVYSDVDPKVDTYWVIKRNGTLKEQRYPRTMLKQNLRLYPLREGYIVHGRGDKRVTLGNPGNAGLYLMRGESYERLIEGTIGGVSISPDGCKVAFGHARNSDESFSRRWPYNTLKMINLCDGQARGK
jgi:hypothetical protein